jgi:molybdate transport system substrate-binding protein
MPEIAAAFERETGTAVDVNLGASSGLARQIMQGAPVDLFVSADESQMDRVEESVGLAPGTRVDLLSNQLVVILPAASTLAVPSVSALVQPGVRRIGIGDPAGVPVGVYARRHLEQLGLWDTLGPKLIPMRNVRAVLAVVESGDVDAGIVYRTDAAISDAVRVAATVPVSSGPRIVYPAAVLRGAPSPEAARRLLAFLRGEQAGRVFERLGFIRLPAGTDGRDGIGRAPVGWPS